VHRAVNWRIVGARPFEAGVVIQLIYSRTHVEDLLTGRVQDTTGWYLEGGGNWTILRGELTTRTKGPCPLTRQQLIDGGLDPNIKPPPPGTGVLADDWWAWRGSPPPFVSDAGYSIQQGCAAFIMGLDTAQLGAWGWGGPGREPASGPLPSLRIAPQFALYDALTALGLLKGFATGRFIMLPGPCRQLLAFWGPATFDLTSLTTSPP
jgi:hypothetical protein